MSDNKTNKIIVVGLDGAIGLWCQSDNQLGAWDSEVLILSERHRQLRGRVGLTGWLNSNSKFTWGRVGMNVTGLPRMCAWG